MIEASSKCKISVDPLESAGRLKQNISIQSPSAYYVEFAKSLIMAVLEKDASRSSASVIDELCRLRDEKIAAQKALKQKALEMKRALELAKALAKAEAKQAKAIAKAEAEEAKASLGESAGVPSKENKKAKKGKKGKKETKKGAVALSL